MFKGKKGKPLDEQHLAQAQRFVYTDSFAAALCNCMFSASSPGKSLHSGCVHARGNIHTELYAKINDYVNRTP